MLNIVLLGFMGTGKTSVGQRISEKLQMSMVDTDTIVETDNQMIIGKIFDKPVKSSKIIGKRVDKYVPNIHKVKRDLKLRINYDLMKSVLLTITRINEKIN